MNVSPEHQIDVLSIKKISKKFDSKFAVHEASWSAKSGQIICLLGHSGCGKTTMLRLIAGLETPSTGCIELNQTILWNDKEKQAPEDRNIGLVFQDYALFPHLSVLENVLFGLKKTPKNQRIKIAEQALQHVSMHHHMHSFPYTLSGGEQQRVALARALAPNPNVLLMDEPFSNLDHRLRDQIRKNTIDLLKKTNTTAVIVTHDPEEALQIADQIILMHQGNIIQIGSPKELYLQPQSLFAARYFSSLNEITTEYRDGRLHTVFGDISLPEHLLTIENKKISCFIRPHQIVVSRNYGADKVIAHVISSSFMGNGYHLNLRIEHASIEVSAQVGYWDKYFENEQVYLSVDLNEAFFFASNVELETDNI